MHAMYICCVTMLVVMNGMRNSHSRDSTAIWGFRKFPLDDQRKEGWVKVLGVLK